MKKIIYSILFGISNILIFSILPFLVMFLASYIVLKIRSVSGEILLPLIFIGTILNIIIIFKLHKKLFHNANLKQSILYAILITISWFIGNYILHIFFDYSNPTGEFVSTGQVFEICYFFNIIFISFLNVIFIFKSINNNKNYR